MRYRIPFVAIAMLIAACRVERPLPSTSTSGSVNQTPRHNVVEFQSPGLKRCQSPPFDYPDPSGRPSPGRVDLAAVLLDPQFSAMGVSLKTFRSAELIFHVSPDTPQATIDCVVAAADDAVAFVTRALSLPQEPDGGPWRDVFLLSADSGEDVLEHLDPGRRFNVDGQTGRTFVGRSVRHPEVHGIFQWKRLPVSYLEMGFMVAHEWVHVLQTHFRGERAKELDVVVEGEANLLARCSRRTSYLVPRACSSTRMLGGSLARAWTTPSSRFMTFSRNGHTSITMKSRSSRTSRAPWNRRPSGEYVFSVSASSWTTTPHGNASSDGTSSTKGSLRLSNRRVSFRARRFT